MYSQMQRCVGHGAGEAEGASPMLSLGVPPSLDFLVFSYLETLPDPHFEGFYASLTV